MAAQTDLWGELAPVEARTPVAILREQAALLGPKTQNLIEATVETTAAQFGQVLQHSFTLVVPALGNYTYHLFTVAHGITELYPVEVIDRKPARLGTEQDFVEWLGKKLSSPETKKLISNLLAQVST
jgi:hypothetical protein